MKKNGFTLVELIIYVAIFAVIVSVFVVLVLDMIKYQAKITMDKNVLAQSQRAMEMITLEIRHAEEVYLATSVFDTHLGQLSLKTRRYLPTGETSTYVDFYLGSDGQLYLKKEGLADQSLTSTKVKIKNLVFTLLPADNKEFVRIQLTATSDDIIRGSFYQATTTLISTAQLNND